MNYVSGMVKCPKCGSQYDMSIHNWCPNCRTTYSAATNEEWGKNGVYCSHTNTVEDTWEVKIETISECGKAPNEIKILIDPIVKGKIDHLMKKFSGTEWLAYLIGNDEDKNRVVDIFIPNQVVNSVNVKNVHCDEYNKLNIIGVIHSHHSMGNSFSHTDDEWINQNHDISLCISKSGINGHVRYKLPCGAYKIINAKVIININSSFDTKEFDEVIDEKIKKETFNYGVYSYGYRRKNYGVPVRIATVNNTNTVNNDKNNPGNYHFTDNPVIHKNVESKVNDFKKELDNDELYDHLSDEVVYKIGKDVFEEILLNVECDMKMV